MKGKKQNYGFIDSQNLNLSIQVLGWKLDFARFRIFLRDKYSVTKAYIFVGYVKGNESLLKRLSTPQNNILDFLNFQREKLEYKKRKGLS